jgi:chromosome segregation ATPase
MVKKGLLIGAGVVVLIGLLFGRDACSYVSTTVGWARDTVKQSVPVEFEIERARRMISNLDDDIAKNMQLIAREEVKIARQTKASDAHRSKLATQRDQIQQLANDLKSNTTFVYSGVVYSEDQVKSELTNRFERFKVMEETADSLVQVLGKRQQGLAAAKEKLKSMQSSKRKLEVEIQNLEARRQMLEVAKTKSEFHFDDSRLSRARQLIDDIGARLEVDEKLTNSDGAYIGEIQLDSNEESADIVQEVTDYFGEGRSEVEALVDSQ